jgi:succinate-semialdehyde dehydrogenase/glutarate-semialdehyde dehydrogenase
MATVAAGELRSVNPATLETVGAVPVTGPADVQRAVELALAAQERWAAEPFSERRRVLNGVARALVERLDEIAAVVVAETGRPLVEAYTIDLLLAIEQVRWLAREGERALAPERLRLGTPYLLNKRAWVVYEPLGVIGVIAPWNLPLAIPLTQAATAVAAGNAVVVKPSELTPLTGAWVERLFAEAGAPEGLVTVVQGGAETGDALVHAPGVAKIVFTGSAEVGRKVATAAGEALRPVTLELGGKDPFVVFADADLERAVDGAAFGAFANSGQLCVGVERIFVERPLYERFVEGLAARARALRISDDVGPLISERQRARVEDLVAQSVEVGAHARAGGRRPPGSQSGWFYEPTVLEHVPSNARIESEEVFGPVTTVAPFDGEDEAVRLANASPFGLGASVWTRDSERARRVGDRLRAGMVWTNDVGYSYGAGPAPWGGSKASGFGRTHGKHGLYDLSNVKYVDADRGRIAAPWWFPYDERAVDGFKGVVRVLHGDDRLRALWRHRRGLMHLGRRFFS